jgi:hypothetical protein
MAISKINPVSTSSPALGVPVNLIPPNLTLRHTYTSTQSVSISTSPVFVVLAGGGGGGGIRTGDNTGGGGAGGLVMGWCAAPTSVTIGAGGTSRNAGGATSVNTFPVQAEGGGGGPLGSAGRGESGAFKIGYGGLSWDNVLSLSNGYSGSNTGDPGADAGFQTGGGGGGARGGNSSIFGKTGGAGSGTLGGGGAGIAGNGSAGTGNTGGTGGAGGGAGGASSASSPVGGTGGSGAVLIYY